MATRNPLTARRGPQIMPSGLNLDTPRALASLDALRGIDADVLLPGHGDPWTQRRNRGRGASSRLTRPPGLTHVRCSIVVALATTMLHRRGYGWACEDILGAATIRRARRGG